MPILFDKIKVKDLDKVSPENDRELWTAKIDGAHSIGILNEGESPRLFSYRISKRTGENIEYTPKLPNLPEKSRVNAQVRFETYAIDKDGKAVHPQKVTAMLNSTPTNSLILQKENGISPRFALIDIDSYYGTDTKNLPFEQKRKLLEEISRIHPEFTLPQIAKTTEEKKRLYYDILKQRHPQTKEGIVVHKVGSPDFWKHKFFKEHDVYVRDIFPEISLTGREPMAGGFSYSWTPEGPVVGQIGTGFSHEMKKDMLNNPERYIGMAARTRAQEISPTTKALIKPSFVEWHVDKNIDDLPKIIFTKEKEYAPGIPKGMDIQPIPEVNKPQEWDFVIQKHEAERAGIHRDYRLGDPNGQAHSWVIPKGLPLEGGIRLAIQQPTHTSKYMKEEGIIPSGYGKGIVSIEESGKAKIYEASDNKIKFSPPNSNEVYVMLRRKPEDRNWLILKKNSEKIAGGPGSGSSEDNWHFITSEYAGVGISPIMSIGKRKAFMESHNPLEKNKKINLDDIKYVSQHKFIKKKLAKFKKEEDLLDIPIEVLVDDEGNYHVMDGHHRFLAALQLGRKKINANIWNGKNLTENKLLTKASNLRYNIINSEENYMQFLKEALQRGMGKPKTEEERKETHKKIHGNENVPPRGTGLLMRAKKMKKEAASLSPLKALWGGLQGIGRQALSGARSFGKGFSTMRGNIREFGLKEGLSNQTARNVMLGGLKRMAPAAGIGAGGLLAGYGGYKALGGGQPSFQEQLMNYLPRYR